MDKDRPPKGVDGLVAIDSATWEFRTVDKAKTKLKKNPLWTMIFHELAESYQIVHSKEQYESAHKHARDRETRLRNQRPYLNDVVYGAGDFMIRVDQASVEKYRKQLEKDIKRGKH